MALSIYASLQGDDRQFRLLILEPSADSLAPIRCQLNQASFDDDLKYTALSYVWGDPLETMPILVNDIETQVTLNLEAALRHIRRSSHIVLWVDALCINQKDEAEKNHQVEMMREIYSGAQLVIAWLGSSAEDSDLAMEILGQGLEGWLAGGIMQSDSVREDGLGFQGSSMVNDKHRDDTRGRDDEGNLTTPDQGSVPTSMLTARVSSLQLSSSTTSTGLGFVGSLSDIGDEHQDEACNMHHSGTGSRSPSNSDSNVSEWSLDIGGLSSALQGLTIRESLAIYRLLTRRWWFRIWVVQEVFLAKTVLFKCGDAEVSRDTMSSWRSAENFTNMSSMLGDSAGPNDRCIPALVILRNLHLPTAEMITAVDYLSVYGRREATRSHDHIYGLFGVIPTKDRILLGTPDYGCRVEDLFISVVTKLMVEYNSLSLLIESGIPRTTTSTKMDLPSWVPDWTRTWFIQKYRREQHSSLDSISEPFFHFSKDAKELVFEGFEFDTIESVQSVPTYGRGQMPIWHADLITQQGTIAELPTLHMLIVASIHSCSGFERLDHQQGFKWVAAFFRELEECRIFFDRRKANNEYDNPDYLAGFLEWIGETRAGRTDEEILEKIFSVKASRSFVEWYHREPSEKLERFYWLYTLIRQGLLGTAGCLMFRTYKGLFGIIRAAAAAGDILCEVPSCRVMLALRKTQSSKYLLVGPSSPIAGTLHGEVAQAVGRGEITKKSFTLV